MTEKEVLEIIEEAVGEGWTKLDLSDKGIESLPGEIGRLTTLTKLYVHNNQLTSVPAELWNLTNLNELALGANKLAGVPAALGKLTELTALDLGRNRFRSVPGELGKLTKLATLWLDSNQLTSLPSELGKLTKLRVLDLMGNKLTSLPAELGRLTELGQLNVSENPLESPPVEVVEQGTEAILAYLREELRRQSEGDGGEAAVAVNFSAEQYEMLRRCSEEGSIAKWNKWREEHPDYEVRLQGAQMEGWNLKGANLRKADLRTAYLSEVDLEGADLREAHLWGAYMPRANLRNALLEDAILGGAHLEGTEFEGATRGDRKTVYASKGKLEGDLEVGVSIGGSSVSDQPAKIDALGFEPYTTAIANFLSHEDTSPPLTMSVEGEWGSGKTSFMLQLKKKLDTKDTRVVDFSPWRHDKEDGVWAAFVLTFIDQLSAKMGAVGSVKANLRLLLRRFDWRAGWPEVVKFFMKVSMYLFAPLVVIGVLIVGELPYIKDIGAGSKAFWGVIGVLGCLGAGVFKGLKQVKGVVGNPFENDLKKYVKAPDYAGRISFVERFHRDFKEVVEAYAGDKKVYVFIDDLDRCEVPKAAELMQAINLMITDDPRMIFIIGMDRRKVAAGLAVKDKHIIHFLRPEVGSNENAEGKSSYWQSGLKYGYEFIEKFIQLPFSLPRVTGRHIEQMMDSIASKKRREDKGGRAAGIGDKAGGGIGTGPDESLNEREPMTGGEGLGGGEGKRATPGEKDEQRLKLSLADDSKEVRDIVVMVAPALDFNPRRIKQFINLFRLRAYIAYETGKLVSREDAVPSETVTLEQLGKIVAILLKWPLLLESLGRDNGLLVRLSLFAEDRIGESSHELQEDDKRWTGDGQLMQLLRFGYVPKRKKQDVERKRYSLVGVSIDSILEVSPVVRTMGRIQQVSGVISAVSGASGAIRVERAKGVDGGVDKMEIADVGEREKDNVEKEGGETPVKPKRQNEKKTAKKSKKKKATKKKRKKKGE